MKLEGRVEKGRLVTDPAAWAIAMREYAEKAVVVDIEPLRERRTPKANKRYWSVDIYLARHYLNLQRPGLPPLNKDEVHALLVTAFAGSEQTELGLVPVRTRTMDTHRFHAFTEQVELFLREKGYPIPDGSDDMSVAIAIEEATA